MLTSTGPSEGKSTITANLAAVLAQSDKKTLLVDTDLRKPTVHRTFRLLNREGLTNALTSQHQFEMKSGPNRTFRRINYWTHPT
jgi:protein-tyrosine kinase